MRFFITFCFILLLSACQAPQLNRFTVNTMADMRPIVLKVNDVQIKSEIMKYDRLPHIEEKLPISPEDALTEWAENRFYGADKLAHTNVVITIRNAYMVQKEELGTNWYTLDNDAYKLTYEVNMAFVQNNSVLYQHTVTGWESSSLPQRSSMADKEATWQKMMNAMIRKVNKQLTESVPDVFKVR